MMPMKETWKKMVEQNKNVPSTEKVGFLLHNIRVN
jgi:hypothetical protein